nr:MAG TPA: hypothetical protein [Caudoviricetes sp.]
MIYSAKAIESCRSHYSFPPYYISLSCTGKRIGMDEPILFSCLFLGECNGIQNESSAENGRTRWCGCFLSL